MITKKNSFSKGNSHYDVTIKYYSKIVKVGVFTPMQDIEPTDIALDDVPSSAKGLVSEYCSFLVKNLNHLAGIFPQ